MQVEGEGGDHGMGELSVQPIGVLYGEMGKCFCLKVIQPFIENIDHNDGSGELIPVFTTLSETADPPLLPWLLYRCLLRPRRVGGRKRSNRPVNILNVARG